MSVSGKTEKDFLHAYDLYADSIFRYCFYRVYNRERAKDLVQESFTRLWKELACGKTIKNSRAFLYQVARNLIIDDSRKVKEIFLEDSPDIENIKTEINLLEKEAIHFEVEQALKLVKELEMEFQEVIILRYIEGYRPQEIAELLKISESLVSVRLHRALKKLKEQLYGLSNPEKNA